MIEQFEVGKFYRWAGPDDFGDSWNDEMNAWKDGETRECLSAEGGTYAKFAGIDGGHWHYGHVLDYFDEVDGVSIPHSPHRASRHRSYLGFSFQCETLLDSDDEESLVGTVVGHASEAKIGIVTHISGRRVYFDQGAPLGSTYAERSNLLLVRKLVDNIAILDMPDGSWSRMGADSANCYLMEQPPYRWRDFLGFPATIVHGTPITESAFMRVYRSLSSSKQAIALKITRPMYDALPDSVTRILKALDGWSLCPICGHYQYVAEGTLCEGCESRINKLPVCAECGTDASEDIYKKIDGNWKRVCRAHSVGEIKCSECGNGFMRESSSDPLMCPTCRASMETCEFCGKQTLRKHMLHYKTMSFCSNCQELHLPDSYHGTRAHSNPTLFGTPPSSFKLYLGAEIEVDYDHRSSRSTTAPKGAVAHMIKELTEPIGVEITSDGSLDNGMELVTQPMTIDFWREQKPLLTTMCRKLVRYGFRGHDAQTAGLHVHVSKDAFRQCTTTQVPGDQRIHYSYFRLAFLMRKFKKEMLAFSRRTNGTKEHYAKNLVDEGLFRTLLQQSDELQASLSFYSGIREGDRYVELNKEFKPTFEFRLFRSTLNVDTLLATVELVQRMCEFVMSVTWDQLRSTTWEELTSPIASSEFQAYNARILALSAPYGDGTEVETEE